MARDNYFFLRVRDICAVGVVQRQDGGKTVRFGVQPYYLRAVQRNNVRLVASVTSARSTFDIGPEAYQFERSGPSMNFAPPVDWSRFLPFWIDQCVITNVGRGIAQDIKIKLKIRYYHEELLSKNVIDPTPPLDEIVTIPSLPSSSRFTFWVGNKRAETLLIKVPDDVTYSVVPGNKQVTQPIHANDDWHQLTLRNTSKTVLTKNKKAN